MRFIQHVAAAALLAGALGAAPASAATILKWQAANQPAAFEQGNTKFGNIQQTSALTPLGSVAGAVYSIRNNTRDLPYELEQPIANIPGALLILPEPGTWATLILGLGLVGAIVRRRRNSIAHA